MKTDQALSHALEHILAEEFKREALYHSALSSTKKLQIATEAADRQTWQLLDKYRSFQEIFTSLSQQPIEEIVQESRVLQAVAKVIWRMRTFKVITPYHEHYPRALVELKEMEFGLRDCQLKLWEERNLTKTKVMAVPPPVLYATGDIQLLNTSCIAVVGTRELKQEYIKPAHEVIDSLVEDGYTIVSGLALGSDSVGHKRAIEHGGRTIAVIGTPLNRFYPKENRALQDEIANKHLLVTPYPFGANVQPYFFAFRNKMIAALADKGLLVIDAGEKSGTLHAVNYEHEWGRFVYVFSHTQEGKYEWLTKHNEAIRSVSELAYLREK